MDWFSAFSSGFDKASDTFEELKKTAGGLGDIFGGQQGPTPSQAAAPAAPADQVETYATPSTTSIFDSIAQALGLPVQSVKLGVWGLVAVIVIVILVRIFGKRGK